MSQIVVTPIDERGFEVRIEGEVVAKFRDGGQAAAHVGLLLDEIRRVTKVAMDHAAWLHSRTPEQVNKLDAATLRATASQFRESIRFGVKTESTI